MWKRIQLKLYSWYSYSDSYVNLKYAIVLFVSEIVLGIIGFMVIEDYSLREAFYMTVITISTVGFTEVKALEPDGQIFTSILILINIGIFAYTISSFSYYVIQGEMFKKIHYSFMMKKIEQLKGHIILCGFGKYGHEIQEHFHKHGLAVVIIEKNTEKVEALQKSAEKVLCFAGDATQDEVLLQAGVEKAQALLSTLPDDTDNLFTVITARQLNKRLKIISRALQVKTEKKLIRAGADHVIMPEQIGGFYMATLVSKPDAVEFFSFITDEYTSDVGFEEIAYEDLPIGAQGQSIVEMKIRACTGANIIGLKTANNQYIVNPLPDTVLEEDSSFIILGNKEQLSKLQAFLEK